SNCICSRIGSNHPTFREGCIRSSQHHPICRLRLKSLNPRVHLVFPRSNERNRRGIMLLLSNLHIILSFFQPLLQFSMSPSLQFLKIVQKKVKKTVDMPLLLWNSDATHGNTNYITYENKSTIMRCG